MRLICFYPQSAARYFRNIAVFAEYGGLAESLLGLIPDILGNALEAPASFDVLEHADVACTAAAPAVGIRVAGQNLFEKGTRCGIPGWGVVVVIPIGDNLTCEGVSLTHICLPD